MPTTDQHLEHRNRDQQLLIVGASSRFFAQSAKSAGFDCFSIDLFGDRDFEEIGVVFKVDRLNVEHIRDALDAFSDRLNGRAKVVFTGGMENRPELCVWLADRFSNDGNHKHFGSVKSPFALAGFCQAKGIGFPEVSASAPIDLDGSRAWLAKPLVSAGGGDIQFGDPAGKKASEIKILEPWYWQRFVEGESFGSTFFARNGQCWLLGSAKQMIGDTNMGVSRDTFSYCGSIGPIEFDESTTEQLKVIGHAVTERFQLKGMFGVDWILDGQRNIWLIEVNPRIPASVECLELAGVVSSVADCHLGEVFQFEKSNRRVVAKAILYSNCDHDVVVSAGFSNELWNQRISKIRTADIPVAGSIIKRGAPVCTVIAIGSDSDDAYESVICVSVAIADRIKKLDAVVHRASASCT